MSCEFDLSVMIFTVIDINNFSNDWLIAVILRFFKMRVIADILEKTKAIIDNFDSKKRIKI
jgi:hypothetical protein